MIKLIATDMDGTLLNGNHRVSKENLQALRSACQSDIHLVIATGRIIGDVAAFIEGYGLAPYYLTMNGAELHDPQQQLLHASYIDPERAKSIYAIMPLCENILLFILKSIRIMVITVQIPACTPIVGCYRECAKSVPVRTC